MADILSQLRALDSKRAALDATIRQTQSRVRSSTAHDDRTTKRHAEDIAASGTPAVASSITVANAAASDSRRLSSPREKQESKPPVVELSEEARKRSKKLFGNLMGHLQKAKTEVAQEQASEKLQQRSLLLSKVEKAAADAQASAQAELAAAVDERRNCFREIQRLHVQLALQSHEQSVRAAAACLPTVANPKIFYKPLVHNASTEAALAARETLLEEEVAAGRVVLEQGLERAESTWAQEDQAAATNVAVEEGAKSAGEEGADLDDSTVGVVGRRRVREEAGDDE